MKIRNLVAAWVLALVTGCGGDGEEGDGASTGVFVDAPVAGLRFATPTRQGLTNASGQFQYRAGEVVTFSLGGIVLGSAVGKAVVSPFDLFGMAPPASEAELRAAANRPGVDAFDRALNVAMFLQALDSDGDLSNGIDLGSWDEALVGATLDFETSHWEFVPDRLETFAGLHPGVNRYIDGRGALTHLYRGLGIAFPVHVVSVTREDDDNDGTIDAVFRSTYDAAGRVTLTRNDYANDGTDAETNETVYDAQGREVTYVYRYDGDDNGTLESRVVTAYVFDPSGNAMTETYERYANEILTRRVVSTLTFDAFGNELTVQTETDENADGVIDERSSQTASYNELGQLLTRRTERDDNADGVLSSIDTYVLTYGLDGFSVSEVSTGDSNADGVYNQRYVYTYTRDAQGRVLTRTTEGDAGGPVLTRSSATNSYDANGNLLTVVNETDSDANGVANTRRTTTRTFDGDNHELTYINDFDSNADGTPDSRSSTVSTYDVDGRLLTQTNTDDDDVNGVIDARRTRARTYDLHGNLIEDINTIDDNNDGVVDGADRTIYEYIEIDVIGAALSDGASKAMLVI